MKAEQGEAEPKLLEAGLARSTAGALGSLEMPDQGDIALPEMHGLPGDC